MSNVIGYVSKQTGNATLTKINGEVVELGIFSQIEKNDLIESFDGAQLEIILTNGNVVTIDGQRTLLLDETVYEKKAFEADEVSVRDVSTVEEGDISELEETEAGENKEGTSQNIGDALIGNGADHGAAFAKGLGTQASQSANGFAADPLEESVPQVGVFALASALLPSGGTGSSGDSGETFSTSSFVDSLVGGVSYTTSSGLSGLTSADGEFNYREGDSVTFNIGGVVIGTVSSENLHDGYMFLQDIAGVELSDVNSNYVENMAIFLQLLDEDGDTSNGITISDETREAFAEYILDIETSGKVGISDALAQVGIEFTPESEMSEDGNNIFETVALDHVAEYIEQFAGDRAPEAFDERTADTVAFNDAPVKYDFTEGEINFDARDLLANTRGQQVLDENLQVKDVALHADFADVGVLTQNPDGSYTITLNEGTSPYALEGLKLDFTITDWTASLEVTSTSLDTNKSHLSVEFTDEDGNTITGDIPEGIGSVVLNVASALTFDTDQVLTIDFPSNDGVVGSGTGAAEWADDVLIPLHYSNDGGATWTQMHGDFTVVLEAGNDSLQIKVDVFDDAIIEGLERFEMTLSGENVYTEDLSFNIIDNDSIGSDNGYPHMSIGFVLAVEGEEFAEFTVSLDKPAIDTITVNYSTFDFSAIAGEDFTATSGTLTILAGETSGTIQVPITDDALIEDTEIAFVNITDPTGSVVIDDMQASLRIFDNDIAEEDKSSATITQENSSSMVYESDTEVIFNVNLDKAFDVQTLVDINVETTMDAGTYGPYEISFDGMTWTTISETGRVRVPAGEDSFQVRVSMNDSDTIVEDHETMDLTVSSYALVGEVTASVTIYNDDVDAPVVNEIGLTNDNTPELSGTAQPGSTVVIMINNVLVGEVPVGDDGTWTYTPSELGEGDNTIKVVTVDEIGNESEPTSIVIDVDTIAPDAPVLADFVDVNGDYSQVLMTGTGEPGATVTLYNKSGSTTGGNETNPDGIDTAIGTVVVDEQGNWSFDISNLTDTPENDNEFFTVLQTDEAGNISSTSEPIHYWHGTWNNVSTETADDIVLMGAGDDSIKINANDANDHLMVDGGNGDDTAIFNENFDQYTITSENGSIIVTENLGSNDVNELRNFETIKFADGEYDTNDGTFNYYPEAQDDSSVSVDEDSSVLINVLANDTDAGNDTLTIQSVTPNENTHGTVEIVDGQILFTPDANYYGPADFDYTVSDGTGFTDTANVSVTVEQVQYEGLTDLGGDANGTPVSFTISGDHYTPDENTVTGQEDVGEGSPSYQIFINGEPFGAVQDVSANRGYIGEDGKMHRDSGEFEVVTFKVPEGTDINSVTIKFLNDAYDGRNDNDGDGIYGEDRNLFVDSMNIGGTVESDGSITGGTTYEAEDKDVAQYLATNGRDVSGREIMPWAGDMTFYPNGVVIEAPSLDLVASSDTGLSDSDNITSDDTPTIQVALGAGTATGDTINISVDGVVIATHVITVADWRAGEVEVELPQLDNGTHEITAVVSNADMSSESSVSETVTIDTGINSGTTEPITAALTDASNSGSNEDSTTNDTTPTITGQTEPGATVEVLDEDGNVIGTVVAGDDGSYEVTTDVLPEGENNLTVRVTDDAGNSEERPLDLVIDTTSTSAPVVHIGNDDGNITNSELSDAGEILVVIDVPEDAVVGDTLNVTAPDGTLSQVEITQEILDDGYEVSYPTPEKGSEVEISATITDQAGNESSSDSNSAVVRTDPNTSTLLQESFENLQETRGWHVETGDVTGDKGTVWDTGENGLEVQSGIVSGSSDGVVHAELDAHHNVTMTTDVALNDSSEYTLAFDVKPRDGGASRDHKDTSDMKITFGTIEVSVNSDENGNLSFETNHNTVVVKSILNPDTGWSTVVIEYVGITDENATVTIEGTGADDSYGMLLDNIALLDAIDEYAHVPEVDVINTNDAPELVNETVSVAEDGLLSGQINATDANEDSLSYSISEGTTVPDTFVLNADGSYSFDADAYDSLFVGETTSFDVAVTVKDGHGGTAEAILTVDVNGVNNDLTYVSETAGYSNVVGYYEVGADGQPLSPAVVSIDNQNGLPGGLHLNDLDPNTEYGFFILANGANEVDENSVITFDTTGTQPVMLIDGVQASHPVYHDTPEFNTDGKDHFVFEADGNGGTNIKIEDLRGLGDADFADVILNVNFEIADKIGDDVQAKNDNVTTTENEALVIDANTLLSNDVDAMGDALVITGVSANANTHGTVELNSDGNVVYTPEAGFNGDASFNYSVSDGNVGSDGARVNVHVIDLPEITNIVDTNGDYEVVTLSGTGEPGATITLFNQSGSTTNGNDTNPDGQDNEISPTTTVNADGTWSIDISNLAETPVNDNEFFSATQDANGSVSATQGSVHYWHGSWSSASTEVADDYVIMGNGNDTLRINDDDANNALVVDGGNGTDKAIFNGAFSSFSVVAEAGTVIITEANGDVNELRNFETVQFSDGNYDVVNDVFTILTPAITDITDTNGDFAEVLLHGTGTTEGNTITITNAANAEVLTTTVLADGSWVVNITNTPKGGDWAFTAQESNADQSSELSNEVHYAHNDYPNSNDDAFDDYVFKGEGNDSTTIDTNDSNDFYLYDGGMGTDRLIFSEDRTNYTISRNSNNEVVVINIGAGVQSGDVVVARNTELFDFNDLKSLNEDELFNGQVIEQVGVSVTELGEVGPNNANGNNPSDVNTQEFDFGSSYEGQVVTLSFDSEAVGTWDQNPHTPDTFTISANGEQLDQINYDKASDTDNTWNDSHSYSITLDAQGRAEVVFDVASTGTDEKVSLTDIKVTFTENSATSDVVTSVDADGFDTLLMSDSIDFSSLGAQSSNIDKIDLTDGAFTIENISAQDVFDMTDADNTLTILKSAIDTDNEDTVTVSNTDWVETTESGVYTATFNDSNDSYDLTLKIETELPVV